MGDYLIYNSTNDDPGFTTIYGSTNGTNSSVGNLTDEDDDYDYDINASIASVPLHQIIPAGIVYGVTLLFGVVGNFLVIFSITRYRRMQSVTNIFLTSLASADLLLVIICVPVKFAKFFTFTWTFGEVLCKLVHYMQNVSVICSVLTLTAMSLERYYAILHPMKAKYTCTLRRSRRVIVAVWIISFFLAAPILYGQHHKEVGQRFKAYWCLKDWGVQDAEKAYELSMLVVIFILPMLVMGFAYISICKELWVVTRQRARMTAINHSHIQEYERGFIPSDHVADKSPIIKMKSTKVAAGKDDLVRRRVIKMLVTVILLFAVCWGPALVDNVLVAFEVVDKLNYFELRYMRMAFSLMSYFNSCVNPIVYAFMSKNFRESFKHALCRWVLRRRHATEGSYNYGNQSSFHTRSTSLTLHTALSTKTDDDVDHNDFRPLNLAEKGCLEDTF